MIIGNKDLEGIHKEINNILFENSLSSISFIRRTIFELLEKSGSLIFHTFKNDSLWGAFFMKDDKKFFIINSSIELEKQIFAAAHELAHSLEIAKIESEVVTVKSITDYPYENGNHDELRKSDFIANRFAAELLVHRTLLDKELNMLPKFLSTEEICVFLSHRFLVPFKTIVRRLSEIKTIDDIEFKKVYNTSEEVIKIYEDIYGLCSENHTVQPLKKYSNFASKMINHYKNELSTYEELKKRLALIDKTPEQYSIYPEDDYTDLFIDMEIDE